MISAFLLINMVGCATVSQQPMEHLERQFLRAARFGNPNMLASYLERVDVNVRDDMGVTALMLAAYEGKVENVNRLLQEKGLDINARDNTQETALHWAVNFPFGGNEEVIKLLLESGIDITLENSAHKTAFDKLLNQPEEVQAALCYKKEDYASMIATFSLCMQAVITTGIHRK